MYKAVILFYETFPFSSSVLSKFETWFSLQDLGEKKKKK